MKTRLAIILAVVALEDAIATNKYHKAEAQKALQRLRLLPTSEAEAVKLGFAAGFGTAHVLREVLPCLSWWNDRISHKVKQSFEAHIAKHP